MPLEERAAPGRRLIERVDLRVLVLVGALLVGLTWVLVLPDEFRGLPRHQYADSTADWLVTRAAVDGLDPYSDLRALAEAIGEPYTPALLHMSAGVDYVHPRLPGAIVLTVPALALRPDGWYTVMTALSALAGAAMVVLIRRMFDLPAWWMVGGLVLLAAAGQVHAGAFYGTQSLLIGLAVTVAWSRLRDRDDLLAGVLIGVVGTLKLFPLLVIIPLMLMRRSRAAGTAIATFAGLNVAGLALFGISPGDVLSGLAQTSAVWMRFSGNGSLSLVLLRLGIPLGVAGVISWLIVTSAVFWFLRRPRTLDDAVALTFTLGVVGSPLAWEHYVTVGLPAAALVLSTSRSRLAVALAGVWVGLLALGRLFTGLTFVAEARVVGFTTLGMGVVLSAAIWLRGGAGDAPSRPEPF